MDVVQARLGMQHDVDGEDGTYAEELKSETVENAAAGETEHQDKDHKADQD